jgi:DNA polymerase III subunit epsilon
MSLAIHTAEARSVLAEKAIIYLTQSGAADDAELISYVCDLPGAPPRVAERLANALCGGDAAFIRGPDGRWCLAPAGGLPPPEPCGPVELDGLSYVVVDVETTGTRPWHDDRITEIAAVIVRDGRVERVWESLINPQRSIPPMITALTSISWAMVKDAPRFGDVCSELLAILEGHVFVAHNAEFDWRFLSSEVRRATGRRLTGRRLCTVRLARRLLPQLRSRRLDALAFHYGIEILGRHRAGGDAQATAEVLLRLMRLARERECASWDDLQRLLAAPRAKRRKSALPGPVSKDTTA